MATQTDKYLIEVSAKLIGDEGITTLTKRLKELELENNRLRQSFLALGGSIQQFDTATKKAGASSSNALRTFQNISYQLTDFAVQTSNGVSAMRAFSQQAPQVAGALGAAGIGGSVGVAVFAIASLAAAMAPAIIAFLEGAGSAKLLNDQLEAIGERRVDIGKIFGEAKSATADLKNLTAEGEKYKSMVLDLEAIQDRQEIGNLSKQLNIVKNAFADASRAAETAGKIIGENLSGRAAGLGLAGRGGAGSLIDYNQQLQEQFGLTLAAAQKLIPSLEIVTNPAKFTRAQVGEAFRQLIFAFGSISNTSKEAQENAAAFKKTLEELRAVFERTGIVSKNTNGELEEQGKIISENEKEWKKLSESVATSEESFQAQLARIRELGAALQIPNEQVQELVDRFTKQYQENLMKNLARDTTSFVAGMLAARKAVEQLNKPVEFLAGLRSEMAKHEEGSKEWLAIAKTLGESATNMEKMKTAVAEVRLGTESDKSLREEWDKYKTTIGLTAEQIKLVEKELFKTKETSKKLVDEIGVAVGVSLSRQVGKFVDTLFDAKSSFSDMVESMITDIAKLIVELTILRTIQMSLKGTAAGDFLFPEAAAMGKVFDKGNVVPFARGGIVTKPTVFPMASGRVGLMGEAGPEAVIPLKRGADGKLGVAGGGGAGVVVNVYNKTDAEASVSQTTEPDGSTRVDVVIENAIDNALARGRFDKSMSNIFGIKRRGA